MKQKSAGRVVTTERVAIVPLPLPLPQSRDDAAV